jgi:hypothetical protein
VTIVNPKLIQAVADGKDPLDYLEPAAEGPISRVLRNGANKYGRRNFRGTEMLWSTYIGALRRHVRALHEGEDLDPDDREHHLAHIGACVHVLYGAMDAGTLKDDRHDIIVTPSSDAVHVDGDQNAKCGAFPRKTDCTLCDRLNGETMCDTCNQIAVAYPLSYELIT